MPQTLTELRQLRQTWLDVAITEEYPKTFVMIAENLGKSIFLPGGRKITAKHYVVPCDYGIVHLLAWEQEGKFDIEVCQFEIEHILVIYLSHFGNDCWSGLRVMYWVSPQPDRADLLFIPGQWVYAVLGCADRARQAESKQKSMYDDFERQRLEKLLLIGETI